MFYGCYNSATGEKLPFVNDTGNLTPALSTTLLDGTAWPQNGGNEIFRHVVQSFTNPGGVVCFNNRIRVSFLALLLFLQGIIVLWFVMIIRVAWKVISGQPADDIRSDDEDEEDEETEENDGEEEEMDGEQKNKRTNPPSMRTAVSLEPVSFVEEEVGVEGLHLVRRTSPGVRLRGRGNHGAAARQAGISTTRDRKELLGRIGCDGPSD
jgi:very-long-chain ceramide synthase